ncbi:MAG TPA: serpin family protein [Novosphingobium sp.]
MPVPVQLDADARDAVKGINAFSIDLYRQTVDQPENHVISPASVSVAMSLAYRASGGTTAEEMRNILHFPAAPTDYLHATSGVLKSMNFKKSGRELATANAIWVDRSVILRPDYLHDTTGLAGSAIEQADFRGAPDAARQTINHWVEGRTNGRIRDLLAPPHVTPATRSVLVNTIYWKANWALPFENASTHKEPFRQIDGRRVQIDLMHQRSAFHVLERNGVKAILLPYEGGELEMAVFLPNSFKGLTDFEKRLTPDRLGDWLTRLEQAEARDTILTLPKMHLGWGKNLVPIFKTMGLNAPFGMDADFSAIATPADRGTLAIGAIVHQTYLDVDENGSEAAAATAVVAEMVISGRRGPPPPPPFVFRADHPYFFILRDRRTGLICFMGRFVTAPAGA